MELIFYPIFFIFLLPLRLLLLLLRLVIIIIHSLINFFTSSPIFFIFLLLLLLIIHSLINFFTSSLPKLNESHKSLTIPKNGAPSTTMDPKQITRKTCTSHPDRKLEPKDYKKPYICDGCKGHGIGKRYRCEECDYELHEDCMLNTPSKPHKLFKNSTFKFYKQHPKKRKNQYCNACGKHVKGFVYHCKKTCKNLHPCCRNPKNEVEIGGVKFRLRETVSKCSWCKQTKIKDGLSKIKGLSYVSECDEDKYNFHVYCYIEMRVEGWKDGTALENLDLRSIQGHLNRNHGSSNKYLRIGKFFLKTVILLVDPTVGLASVLVDVLL